ncbi:MAG: DoxX family protein [Nitriliruptoraceae bacterium]
MHRFTWVLQWLLGLYFIAVGVMHLAVPEGLPGQMDWMYDLPRWLHVVSGTAEIAGGLGLILPGLTRIRPQLTAWAAAGLGIVMIGAVIWHLDRGEVAQILSNLVLAGILAFVAWVRWRRHPLAASKSPDASEV